MTTYEILDHRALIRITGDDRKTFLQGLITNDIQKLSREHSIYAAMLTPQGKFLYDFILFEKDEAIYADVDKSTLPALLKRLIMYKLRAKVAIEDISNDYLILSLRDAPQSLSFKEKNEGETIHKNGISICIDPRDEKIGLRTWAAKNALQNFITQNNLTESHDYHHRRIQHTIPEAGSELISEDSFPLYFRFEKIHGVDFDKGCYVGQEVTARMKHRANIRKGLHTVTLSGPPVATGTTITQEGKNVGELYTVREHQALALLNLEAIEKASQTDTPLMAGDTMLKVEPS